MEGAVDLRISVVIPFLNEEENLPHLYERLTPVLRQITPNYEIVFVDDGSTDGSLQKVLELSRQDAAVKLVSLSRNYGHQIALTAGIDHASGDVVITMDADLQHPPEYISRFIEKWREGFDVVHGVKTTSGKRGFFKALMASFYYGVMKRIAGIEIVPHASDYRLLSRQAAEAIRSHRESTRFLRGLVNWIGFRSTTLMYEPDSRFAGEPKYSIRRLSHLAMSGILSFSIVPLRLSLYMGMLIGVAFLIYTGFTVAHHVYTATPLDGWKIVVMLLLFLSSIQLTMMGIAGEYLGRIFEEVKHRPLYLVQRRVGVQPVTR